MTKSRGSSITRVAKVSRRNLIVSAAAAPLVAGAAASSASGAAPQSRATGFDPIVGEIQAWTVEHAARDALMCAWQVHEAALCKRMEGAPSGLAKALRRGSPEAEAMRRLDRQIKAASKRLDGAARRIARNPAVSVEGTLAKLEMAVTLQGPDEWQEHAHELVLDSIKQLRSAFGTV